MASPAIKAQSTSLYYVSAKDPALITEYLSGLGFEVRIWSINHNQKKNRWYLWYCPPSRLRTTKPIINVDL